jgi:antirestriction protein ArdC
MIHVKQNKNEHYLKILDKLIEEMEQGKIPWQQPWFTRLPKNYISRRSYSGINVFILNEAASMMHFKSHYWITARQATIRGGIIKKDEPATYIVMAKWQSKEWKDKEGKNHIAVWLMSKNYPLYNLDQTYNLKIPIDDYQDDLFTANDHIVENILKTYADHPPISYKYDKAFYSPGKDEIGMPHVKDFVNKEEFACTLFHELVHSTGNKKRLARSSFNNACVNKIEDYAKEELVAEIGAAFLCAEYKLFTKTKKNSAAYLSSWLKSLKNDNTFLFRASSQAQQAVNYIFGQRVEQVRKSYKEPTLFDDIADNEIWDRSSTQIWD